jgi:hypothetical protein
MKVLWGALMVDGRNKIGGQVASKNRGGAYMRTKVTPVNPQTASQSIVRNRLAGISQSWRGLTAAQRAAWNGAVSNYARTDIFGNLKNPSGFALYQRLNNIKVLLGEDASTNPPLPSSVGQFSNLVLTYTSGTPALSLAFSVAAGDDTGYLLFATPPLSPGIDFVKSEYRLIKSSGSNPTSPLNLLADYVAKFGSVGAVGTKIFVKLVPAGSTTGITGTAVSANTISAA